MGLYSAGRSRVIINEIDLSQVVTGSAVTVACENIVSTQGSPEPLLWTDAQSFLNHYGNPDASISFDVYTALDFFREGNQMWARRVVGAGALYGGVIMSQTGSDTQLTPATAGVVNPQVLDWTLDAPAGSTPIALFWPRKGQGSYSDNIAVSITSPNLPQVTGLTSTTATTGGTMAPGNYTYQVCALSENGMALASTSHAVVIGGTVNTNAITLTWDEVPGARGYRVFGRAAAGYGMIIEVGQGVVEFIDTGAITPDVDVQPIVNPADLPPVIAQFVVNVFDLTQSLVTPMESFDCTLTTGIDGDGVATELEERINPFSQYIYVSSNVAAIADPSTIRIDSAPRTAMAGGDSGTAPTSFDVARAWGTWSNTELYNCNTLINGGHADPGVQMAMEELARGRGDAVALLDVPSAKQTSQAAVNYRNLELNLNSSYAALFSPDVLEADNINGKQQFVPFSGWAGALCARTDRVANPSYAIAGLNRGLVNVLRLRQNYGPGEMDNLFNAQVNYVKAFVGQGTALWEQRTLQAKSSALSWLSVRRIVNVIKVALYNFGLYVIHEPIDEITQRQVTGSFSDYLQTLKNARALHDFTVISDRSNNTVQENNEGILRVTVIIIPVIPVSKLVVDLVVSKQGVSFDETVSQLYAG